MQDTQYIVWNPMRNYSHYSRTEILQATEEYMAELLKGYERWGELLEKYETAVNKMLRERKTASEIVKLVQEEDFQTCTRVEYLFSCFSVACKLAQIEEENGKVSNISGCDCMEEVCEHMQQIIFGLRRIEFGWEEENHQLLLERIEKWNISYVFLGELICQRTITEQVKTADGLARLFEKQGKHREVILFLFYMASRLEYETETVMAFTNVLLETGDIYWGNEMLQKVKNPSYEILQLQAMLAERIQG